jgi:hypothetical protein
MKLTADNDTRLIAEGRLTQNLGVENGMIRLQLDNDRILGLTPREVHLIVAGAHSSKSEDFQKAAQFPYPD